MPDEIQEWQQLHDMAARIAAFAAKRVAALKAARREKVRRSHLKGLAWMAVAGAGGVRAWEWASGQRTTIITGVTSAAVAGTAGAAIACQSGEAKTSTESQPRPAVAAPLIRSDRTPPTSKPPQVPRRAAPPPSPSPTPIDIPDLPIPTTLLPTIDLPSALPSEVEPTRPPLRPPTIRPPRPGPSTLDDCILKLHIGDLRLLACPKG